MNNRFDITLGIPEPELDYRLMTSDDRRRAIFEASRDSALVRAALIEADGRGYGGEDRYVLLAYLALVQVEQLYRQVIDLRMKDPCVPVILRPRPRDE